MKKYFKNMCFYTTLNRHNVLCMTQNSYTWKSLHPAAVFKGKKGSNNRNGYRFMCGRRENFQAKLGSRNGVKAGSYLFKQMLSPRTLKVKVPNNQYSRYMRKTCKKYGMKPV